VCESPMLSWALFPSLENPTLVPTLEFCQEPLSRRAQKSLEGVGGDRLAQDEPQSSVAGVALRTFTPSSAIGIFK